MNHMFHLFLRSWLLSALFKWAERSTIKIDEKKICKCIFWNVITPQFQCNWIFWILIVNKSASVQIMACSLSRWQSITWTSVDYDACHQMTSLSNIELTDASVKYACCCYAAIKFLYSVAICCRWLAISSQYPVGNFLVINSVWYNVNPRLEVNGSYI